MDSAWWLEPDVDGRVFGVKYDSETERLTQGYYKARLYCFNECPLLVACREAGWSEQHNVWGGLLPRERRQALESGQLNPSDRLREAPAKPVPAKWFEIEQLLLDGWSIEEITQHMGFSKSITTRRYLDGLVRAARERRERQEQWEAPSRESRRSFRAGRGRSPKSWRESA